MGLIGLSRDWQQRHYPALRTLQERFELRGVYSSVMALADGVAREFGAQAFDGFYSMVSREDIDAIMMLEGDWYGLAPLIAACENGKAIYCGGEVDFDPHKAADLKRVVEDAGVAFMAEFPRRFAPASLRLKELIATRLGKPKLLFCHRRMTCESSENRRNGRTLAARADRELVELIDWCRFIVGREVRAVQAVRHPVALHAGESDYQVMSLDLSEPDAAPCSTLAQISCGAYIPAAWHEAIAFRPPAAVQVCCENGLAFVDLPNSLVWFDEAGRHQESLDSEMPVGQQLLTQFHRAVTSLVRKTADLEDIYRNLMTLQMARHSMSSGQRAALS